MIKMSLTHETTFPRYFCHSTYQSNHRGCQPAKSRFHGTDTKISLKTAAEGGIDAKDGLYAVKMAEKTRKSDAMTLSIPRERLGGSLVPKHCQRHLDVASSAVRRKSIFDDAFQSRSAGSQNNGAE